jgi:uncharacterized protein
MNIETNLSRIKALARKREDENWEFRTYLKSHDLGDSVDRLAQQLYEEIAPQIDCTTCGNCCREEMAVLDQEDVEIFAQGLGMSPADLTAQYLVEEDHELAFEMPCPFLDGTLCRNYGSRPKGCRSFPHLHKKGFAGRLFSVVVNYGVCPIVFNVYERLKSELWPRSARDKFSRRRRIKGRR